MTVALIQFRGEFRAGIQARWRYFDTEWLVFPARNREKGSNMLFLTALGGNIGEQPELFDAALRWLEQRGLTLRACSGLIRTAPVGSAAGGEFLNAAALLEGDLEPLQVLRLFQQAENGSGRERIVRWGPRTLDLDLLLADHHVLNTAELILPHPAMWYRDFVLRPATEIAGELVHPLFGCSVRQLFERLQQRPLRLRLIPDATPDAAMALSLPADFHQQLAAEVPKVEWLSAGEPGDVFADVRLLTATASQPPCSYPLPQPATRTLTIYIKNIANAVDQLRQLCIAIGCTR